MLDDMDNILFPNHAPITEEPEPIEVSLDEMEAPESIEDEQSIEDDSLTVEYDDLSDDSDDFHGEEE